MRSRSGRGLSGRLCRLLAVLVFCGVGPAARVARAGEIAVAGADSAAVAEALRRAQPGDTVRLPAGDVALTDTIRIKSGIRLLGAGQDRTRLLYAGDAAVPFITVSGCEDAEIAHLAIDGRGRPLGQDGIRATDSRRLSLHDLAIRHLARGSSAFVHGIIFTGHNPTMERGVTDSLIRDCTMESIGVGAEFGGGIRMAWGSVRNRVEGNVIRDTGRGGIFGDHSAELVIRGNRVSGSGGEGLGIEIWGGCPRSLIEDNVIDHWLSVDGGHQSAVRRNVIGTDDGTLKGYGIEIIARDVVVTDNVVTRGAAIGLSVSNVPRKDNVYWGYNRVGDCAQWGAQWQGETGGIAHHYFYRCEFARTVRGDPRARYPQDSGHGFRFNGHTRAVVFEDCAFRENGGYAIQIVGREVDFLSFVRCEFTGNRTGVITGVSPAMTIAFSDGDSGTDAAGLPPGAHRFSAPPPVADFRSPPELRAGTAARFACTSTTADGEVVERLWDFGDGIPATETEPSHTYAQPGAYRVTLITWDARGRGARAERTLRVLPAE
jgi:parallel beta-helix repeat protein